MENTILAGRYYQKVDTRTGHIREWVKFEKDTRYEVVYNAKIMTTVLKVSSGPHKGSYV